MPKIKKGDYVVDLGSGAGNDCFVARAETGESGKVVGIDFTPEMIEKARNNADKLGFNNVEFRLGDIENIPLMSNVADVVVSNCVMNLVPNKPKLCRSSKNFETNWSFFRFLILFWWEICQKKLKCCRNVRWLCSFRHSNGRLFENY